MGAFRLLRGRALSPTPTIPFASPSLSGGHIWDGTLNSGYATTPTPTTMVGATAVRLMPTAQFLTVPFQTFGADFTVHVMARAPGGIASVEFFHENPTTTTVTASQLNTIPKTDGTTKIRDTFAIKLKASDWCASGPKMAYGKTGGAIYAKVTANDGTLLPRIIGPLQVRPMALNAYGDPNDFVALVTPDGKDNSGSTVVPLTGATVYSTLALAEAAIVASNYSSPMIKFMKTGTYTRGATRTGWFNGQGANGVDYCWWPITHAPGVVATIVGPTVTDFTLTAGQYINALWYISRKKPEFRGPGIIIDHQWLQYAQADSVPNHWDNGCKHTVLNVAAATDPNTGLSSVTYNTYFDGSPNPACNASPSNAVTSDPGICSTDAAYEYGAFGTQTRSTLIVDGSTFKETFGDPFVNNLCCLHNYLKGQVTQRFDPGVQNCIHITYTGANATATVAKVGNNGEVNSKLVLTDSAAHDVVLRQSGDTASMTLSALKTAVEAFAGWHCTIDAAATTSGFAAKYIHGPGGEDTTGATNCKSVTVDFGLIVAVHTELLHFSGGDWTDGGSVPHQDNYLVFGNVLQPNAWWGTANWYIENSIDNSWIANNLTEVSHQSGTNHALTRGSNLSYLHNYNSDAEIWDTAYPGTDGTRYGANIIPGLASVGGAVTALTGVAATGNLTGSTSLVPLSGSNVLLSGTEVTNLFQGSGNYLPGGSSVIPSHLTTPLETYDLFYNLRDPAGDYAGPISKSQASMPAWAF